MNDWDSKSQELQEQLSQLIGSVHDNFLHDSLTINRDIFFKLVIKMQKEINHMKSYGEYYRHKAIIKEKENQE